MSHSCRICGNSQDNRNHKAREMMFGTRETFEYFECSACGTIQIAEVPELSRYYPENYLSFDSKAEMGERLRRRVAARFAGKYFLTGRGALGKWIAKKKPWIGDHFPVSLRDPLLGIDFNSRILDFGCGAGRLLRSLYYFGFHDLTGADAFIKSDISYPGGVKIYKRELESFEPYFDLIMLHHSFEHVIDPQETLGQIHRLLADNRFCLIRMPVAGFTWEKYGVNWVQMDPPRHLYLYTERSFRRLAETSGFVVEKVVYDSTAFQFWGSEKYLRDMPLINQGSSNGFELSDIFSGDQLNEWQRQAEALNARGMGDQACFYLRKMPRG